MNRLLPFSKTRVDYADQIVARLWECKDHLQREFHLGNRINSCYVDHLLNESDVEEIYAAFPNKEEMLLLKDLREHKHVMVQLDRAKPVIEEIVYAFQDPRVVSLVSKNTGLEELVPDQHLYAGGISIMDEGCFLNPHLDNSHDKDRKNYRVLNLLYYISPDWQESYGGHLELWDQGLRQPCRLIHYRFNRLVIMVTNRSSWHSVSPVRHQGHRCCINNYYFSPKPADNREYFHVTSFRGRSEDILKDIVLQTDTFLRNHAPRELKNLIRKPKYYKK